MSTKTLDMIDTIYECTIERNELTWSNLLLSSGSAWVDTKLPLEDALVLNCISPQRYGLWHHVVAILSRLHRTSSKKVHTSFIIFSTRSVKVCTILQGRYDRIQETVYIGGQGEGIKKFTGM
jgi:hypothetical protein